MLKRFVFLTVLLTTLVFADNNSKVTDKQEAGTTKPLPIMHGVGGDFTAIGDDGKPFKLSRYHGKIILLFFGYTNCADICPFTLGYLKDVYEKLTPAEQALVQVVFVTVDPEYDTPEHLHEFIDFFNKDFTAVTGTRADIDKIVNQYQASYNKTSGGGKVKTKEMRRVNQKNVADKNKDEAYVYSHTVSIYVMDAKGRMRSLEYTGTKQKLFLKKIRQLIDEAGGTKANNKAVKKASDEGATKNQVTAETVKKTASKVDKKSTIKLPIPINYWVHLGPPNTRVMAAYGEFINMSDKDIYLTGVDNSDFDHVELHESIVKDDVGEMVEHKEFLISAGESLKFEAGKRHMMLVTPLKRFKHNGKTTMILHYRVEGSDEKLTQKLVFPVSFTGADCGVMPLN